MSKTTQIEELREKIKILVSNSVKGISKAYNEGSNFYDFESLIDLIANLFTHQLELAEQKAYKDGVNSVNKTFELAKIEAKIEQSYRCQELIEANRANNEGGERYGEIALLDVDDLQDELSELTKQKEELR